MEVWLNPNGTRNRENRPLIDQEEGSRNVYLYDPYRSFHYGLYDQAQPTCGSWLDIYHQYPSKVPVAVTTNTGRLLPLGAKYFTHGMKYDALARHSSP